MLRDVLVGRCPLCGGGLEPRKLDGECSACNVLWSHRDIGGGALSIRLTIPEEPEAATTSNDLASNVVPFPVRSTRVRAEDPPE